MKFAIVMLLKNNVVHKFTAYRFEKEDEPMNASFTIGDEEFIRSEFAEDQYEQYIDFIAMLQHSAEYISAADPCNL